MKTGRRGEVMATIWIPALLRKFTAGQDSVPVPGSTLLKAIDALDARFPGIRERLCADEDVRFGLAAVIDGQVNREGLAATLREDSEVYFIPAISGGQKPVVGTT
jgi:sulfur-carrier protein